LTYSFQPGLLAKEELIAFDWSSINASRQMSSFATFFMPNNPLSVDYQKNAKKKEKSVTSKVKPPTAFPQHHSLPS
jgi:hypothetical protein